MLHNIDEVAPSLDWQDAGNLGASEVISRGKGSTIGHSR